MTSGFFKVVFGFWFAVESLQAQASDKSLNTLLQQYKTSMDKNAYLDAASACAAALMRAPDDPAAQSCATTLKNSDRLSSIANAGKAA